MKTATVAFKTVGCRLNQAETAALRAAFEAAGYAARPFGEPCDVCVIHGCAVTARAEKDSLRLARVARRSHPGTFVILAGCVAEIGGATVGRAAGADLVAGQQDKYRLPALLARRGFAPAPPALPADTTHPQPLADSAVGAVAQAASGEAHRPAPAPRFDTTRAIVKIQDGCEFDCAYCIVPRARGRCRSRSAAEIVAEVRALAEAGHREIVVTGANIGCYQCGPLRLAGLLERLETETPIARIRISSLEITTVERPVIEFMAASNKLCRFLHLPLQSGCDAVLAAMGRRYTTRQYRDTVEYALARLGRFGLGTDVLAGFPGEDAAGFAETERFVESLPFSNLHVFAYSPRPGTKAAGRDGQVAGPEKQRRVARLIALGRRQRRAFAREWIGREVEVLVEALDASGRGKGWTGEYLPARISGRTLRANSVVRFRPEAAEGELLLGHTPGG